MCEFVHEKITERVVILHNCPKGRYITSPPSVVGIFRWVMLVESRVSTGIPGYGLRTELIRKFFPFPLWKRFRKTGIPERFFFVKRKFPERCSGITDRYGIPERSGISFWKFSVKSFRKFPVSGTIGTIITLKSYICKYNTS